MEKFDNITLHHGDCMDILRELQDNAYDLAIVDPPYSKAGGRRISHGWNMGGEIWHIYTELGYCSL